MGSLYRKVFDSNDEDHIDVKKFDDTETILNRLKDLPANRRKTILSALVAITHHPKYKEQMMADVATYQNQIRQQQKTESQKENWVTTDDVKKVWDSLEQQTKLLYKKKDMNVNDLQTIQNFVILTVMSGLFFPPRRSLDWCAFKVNKIDRMHDNYIDKNEMVFNTYKTAKSYGEQRIRLPLQVKKILNKWIKFNLNQEYLFHDVNGQRLTAVKITQRLNAVFGKRVGANLLRHAFLTDKFADTIDRNREIAAVMGEMGSSPEMLSTYVKKSDPRSSCPQKLANNISGGWNSALIRQKKRPSSCLPKLANNISDGWNSALYRN